MCCEQFPDHVNQREGNQRSQLEDKTVFCTPFHAANRNPTLNNAKHFSHLSQKLDIPCCCADNSSQFSTKLEVSIKRSKGSKEGCAWVCYQCFCPSSSSWRLFCLLPKVQLDFNFITYYKSYHLVDRGFMWRARFHTYAHSLQDNPTQYFSLF